MDEQEGGNKVWIVLVAAGVAVAGGGLYFARSYFKSAAPVPVPMAIPKEESPLAKLTLEQGDALLKEKSKGLSGSLLWTQWLKTEDLLRRVVAATALVADGKSPRASVEFLGPIRPFRALQKKGTVLLDPASYERYDAIAEAVRSLDTDRTAAVLRDLKPLFDKALAELGGPKRDFNDVWLQAVSGLLSTPVVEGEVRLKKKVTTYVMLDESLERLNPAQKHLLRMGPKNSVTIQGKLRQISVGLGIPESKLPVPQTYKPK